MLIHASARDCAASVIAGDAHIVLSIDTRSDSVCIRAFARGEFDSSYAALPEERLSPEILKLLAELRTRLSLEGA